MSTSSKDEEEFSLDLDEERSMSCWFLPLSWDGEQSNIVMFVEKYWKGSIWWYFVSCYFVIDNWNACVSHQIVWSWKQFSCSGWFNALLDPILFVQVSGFFHLSFNNRQMNQHTYKLFFVRTFVFVDGSTSNAVTENRSIITPMLLGYLIFIDFEMLNLYY